MDLLANPRALLRLARLGTENAAALVRLGTDNAPALVRLLLREPDPKGVFKGKLAPAKRMARSEPVALVGVRKVASLVGGIANDVMLAAIAGALRRYLQRSDMLGDGLMLHAGLSVIGRASGAEPGLGSQVGALRVPLPVGLADPIDMAINTWSRAPNPRPRRGSS